MNTMKVSVRLFGAFRNYLDQSEIVCELPEAATPQALRPVIESVIGTDKAGLRALIAESVLASESRILSEDERIEPGSRLALLPPVNGG